MKANQAALSHWIKAASLRNQQIQQMSAILAAAPVAPAHSLTDEKLRWIAVSDRLPPEGLLVETKIKDKQGECNEQPLKRRGRLWFFADESMYVYYTPTHWASRTTQKGEQK